MGFNYWTNDVGEGTFLISQLVKFTLKRTKTFFNQQYKKQIVTMFSFWNH